MGYLKSVDGITVTQAERDKLMSTNALYLHRHRHHQQKQLLDTNDRKRTSRKTIQSSSIIIIEGIVESITAQLFEDKNMKIDRHGENGSFYPSLPLRSFSSSNIYH